MKFGPLAVAASEGAIVAHALKYPGLVLKKGERVGGPHVALLQAAGLTEIIVAQLEPGDVHEDAAAHRLASSFAGANLTLDRAFTGRCNLFAACNGVLRADAATIDAVNAVDESITVATLRPLRRVEAGEMIATVKIIPFAVSEAQLLRCLDEAQRNPLSIAPFRPLRVGVVSTLLPSLKPQTVMKTLRILEARLAPAGATITVEKRVPHTVGALADAIATITPMSDLVIVFGASAITDRRDVIPTAVEKAGGHVLHLGMPVDPGNLLLIGTLSDLSGSKPVIGAPGCARSPKENGFDFVLERLLAGVEVGAQDIRRMGVGGLLMEIGTRPQPRSDSDG